jgi:hypothetical protein
MYNPLIVNPSECTVEIEFDWPIKADQYFLSQAETQWVQLEHRYEEVDMQEYQFNRLARWHDRDWS